MALNYKGDIELLHELGFDGVKMDDCGAQKCDLFDSFGLLLSLLSTHILLCVNTLPRVDSLSAKYGRTET